MQKERLFHIHSFSGPESREKEKKVKLIVQNASGTQALGEKKLAQKRNQNGKKNVSLGVASKQKTRTMSAFLGGEGGGGLKFQKTRTFWGFFFLENFFLHWGCTRF